MRTDLVYSLTLYNAKLYALGMADTFYRFHWADCPEFSADNAWSALWGRERSEDGSQTRCECGDFADYERDCAACRGCGWDDCNACGGTGWNDCVRGYSAERTAEGLVSYFGRERGGAPVDEDGRVLVFVGDQVGNGFDGEPTVLPAEIVESLTWSEFAARYAAVTL